MATTTIQKAGRQWKVDGNGVQSLTREYQVIDSSIRGGDGEESSFSSIPAIGSAHPTIGNLFVAGYDVSEGADADKKVTRVAVNYERLELEAASSTEPACAVEKWAWDVGTVEKELTVDMDGKDVLNSAKDPFDSVPRYKSHSPTFTKVFKTAARMSGALAYNCKTNSQQMTIGDFQCAVNTLLCTVAEERIIGDASYKYRYTVSFQYLTNKTKIARNNTEEEIGWDVAVMDCGMRQFASPFTGEKEIIQYPDPETKRPCKVTSLAPLDGQGRALLPGGSAQSVIVPYVFRFRVYEQTTFPSIFTSEPT